MKIKTRLNRQTGEMSVEYFVITDMKRFRLRLWQKVLADTQLDVVLMVDTNQRITETSVEDLMNALISGGVEPLVLPIAANQQRLFGISYTPKKNKAQENLFLISLAKGTVPDENALSALLEYDVAVGIGPGKTLQELGNLLCTGTPLYGSGLFEREMYDSILCAAVRSSFDISQIIKEMKDEMGI